MSTRDRMVCNKLSRTYFTQHINSTVREREPPVALPGFRKGLLSSWLYVGHVILWLSKGLFIIRTPRLLTIICLITEREGGRREENVNEEERGRRKREGKQGEGGRGREGRIRVY